LNGVFSTDATDIALNLIKKAKTGESIYRGTFDLGIKDEVPLGMIKSCHAVIVGRDPGYDVRKTCPGETMGTDSHLKIQYKFI
jgi:hypothetical protein